MAKWFMLVPKSENLSISGERKSESEEKDEKRTFHLPANIEKSKVEAEFNDGVLRVHLPKRQTKH